MKLIDIIFRLLTILLFGPICGIFFYYGIDAMSHGTYISGAIILGTGVLLFTLVSAALFPDIRNV